MPLLKTIFLRHNEFFFEKLFLRSALPHTLLTGIKNTLELFRSFFVMK